MRNLTGDLETRRESIAHCPMTEADLPRWSLAWNSVLIHDQASLDHLRHAVLGDPNYEPEGVVVAEDDDGGVLGLSACIVRRTAEGKDGQGDNWEFGVGFLKAFFVLEGADGERAAADLLEASEAFSRAAGKRVVQLTLYSYHYLFPGLDLRYERLRETMSRHAYRDIATIEDVAVDLRGEEVAARLTRYRGRAGSDAEVLTWEPGLLPMMRCFVEEAGRRTGSRSAGRRTTRSRTIPSSSCAATARSSAGRALARADARAALGPFSSSRGSAAKATARCCCWSACPAAQARGSPRMTAGWANTGFYVSQGWSIVRRYAVFRKELAT